MTINRMWIVKQLLQCRHDCAINEKLITFTWIISLFSAKDFTLVHEDVYIKLPLRVEHYFSRCRKVDIIIFCVAVILSFLFIDSRCLKVYLRAIVPLLRAYIFSSLITVKAVVGSSRWRWQSWTAIPNLLKTRFAIERNDHLPARCSSSFRRVYSPSRREIYE